MRNSIHVYGRNLAAALGMVFLATAAVPGLKADPIDKKVIMTFSAPFEVPGHKVLPAGTYVFKSPRGVGENFVEIMNADETQPLGMFQTVEGFGARVPDNISVQFEERRDGAPRALKSWTYPGFGEFELLYPGF